jgi:very-short-patch-repair endonuclease
VEVAQALLEVGGIADARTLGTVCTRHQVSRAVASGQAVRLSRGRFGLPGTDEHRAAAAALSGALWGLSAARHWGWKVKLPPTQPQVLVPRGRNVAAARRAGIDVRWGAVSTAELREGVTSKVRTTLDCARWLPFDAGLAVVDSALRDGVSRTTLVLACADLPRQGRSRAYRVVELGSPLAANPFESVVRAILEDVPGARFRPQVWVGNSGRADLVDEEHRLVVECDSFEFHADAASLNRDMERYNAFVCAQHQVLRFGWRHAMFEQDYVRATVAALIAAQERSARACRTCGAA